jgi:hypothetical protein
MPTIKLKYWCVFITHWLALAHRTSPRRLIRCSSFLAAKDHASTQSPCCCNPTSIRTNSTNFSPAYWRVPLRSKLSCLLLWLCYSSRQLQCPASRFVQSSSLHFITLRSLSNAHVHFVWVMNQRARMSPPWGRLRGGQRT